MLNYIEIKNHLLKQQFRILKETSKKIAMQSKQHSNPVYVNKTAGSSPSTLIVHPDYENVRTDLSNIEDVIVHKDFWYHSSNMRLFPKRLNTGAESIGYGIPFGFRSEESLNRFINLLTGGQYAIDDPFADLVSSETQLSQVPSTTKDALIKARIGQGLYRDRLIEYWGGCAVTECKTIELLVASHSKPWIKSNNEERLDPFNGLLLTPNLDKAFDKGYITFKNNGEIQINPNFPETTAKLLGIDKWMKLTKVDMKHHPYLEWHRNEVFCSR